jgi:hypothetical protein
MYKFRWLFIITSITLLGSIAMFKQNVAAGGNSKGEILGSPLVFDWFGESPTSDKILFSVLSDRLTLYLSSPKENWETKITDDLGWAAWSPVEDQFIYWTSKGALFWADATTGKANPKLIAQEVTAASFAPHGQALVILRTDFDSSKPGIYLLNLDSQKEELLTQEIASGIGIRGYAPLWSPDSRYLLFLRSARQGEPYPIYNLTSSSKKLGTAPAAGGCGCYGGYHSHMERSGGTTLSGICCATSVSSSTNIYSWTFTPINPCPSAPVN